VLRHRFNKLDNNENVGKKLYAHPTGRTKTEGEKELHKVHVPHRENVKERKILEN
jgi:hypothetical protein